MGTFGFEIVSKDFDLIGAEFHRWVRDHEKDLQLCKAADFAQFIERDFNFYTRQYLRIRRAAEKLAEGLERIYYNAQINFTLQYPVLLAPLRPDDPEQEILRKLRITAAILDILITRRIWNFRAIDYSTMQYAMFLVMKEIRGRSADEVAYSKSVKAAFDFGCNQIELDAPGEEKTPKLLFSKEVDPDKILFVPV